MPVPWSVSLPPRKVEYTRLFPAGPNFETNASEKLPATPLAEPPGPAAAVATWENRANGCRR